MDNVSNPTRKAVVVTTLVSLSPTTLPAKSSSGAANPLIAYVDNLAGTPESLSGAQPKRTEFAGMSLNELAFIARVNVLSLTASSLTMSAL